MVNRSVRHDEKQDEAEDWINQLVALVPIKQREYPYFCALGTVRSSITETLSL